MIIKIDKFIGQIPKIDPYHLPSSAGQVARGFKIGSGALRPYKIPANEWSPTKVGTINSIYLYADQYWFHWLEDVDVADGVVADDTADRVYFTDGVNEPQMTFNTLALGGGGTDYPIASYDLGVPAPVTAPTLAENGTSSDASEEETTGYVYTFVSAYGEEGPPSPVSETIDVHPDDQTVTLSNMDGNPGGNRNLTHKNVYRLNNGVWQFVTQLDIAITTWEDTVAGEDLGEVLPSTNWDPPPTDMIGLINLPGEKMAGFSGKQVSISAAGFPHAWPIPNRYKVDNDIVGLGRYGNTVLVLTVGRPTALTGDDPGTMFQEELDIRQACSSKQSIVNIGLGVVYACPDGLALIGHGTADLLTREVIDRDDWQALDPTSIRGVVHDEFYFGFYDDGTNQAGFIYDFSTSSLVFHDYYATAAFTDVKRDKLYFVDTNGEIMEWNSGASNLTARFKSRPFVSPRAVTLTAGQVYAESYPVTLKLYEGGKLRSTKVVSNRKPFRLNKGYTGDEFEVEVLTKNNVKTILVSESMEELKNV